MKKKIILAVVIVLVTVTVALSSIPIVNHLSGHKLYNDVLATVSPPVNKDGNRVIYALFLSGAGKGMKLTEDESKKMETIGNEMREFYASFTEEDNAPYYVEARYENKDGKTVITYRGEITNKQTGKKEPFEKVFKYDFILTKNIRNEDISEMKYFR